MKNKNSFIFKGLISLMLSLVMICGTAVTSLSAVTDQVVAAVKEPVRSAIPDAPAPAQATDETDLSPQSASNAPDYAVAEGSLTDEPTDDDVLDIAIDDDTPAVTPSAPRTLTREKDTDLVATGAAVTGQLDTSKIYYLGADSDTYRLVYESGWKVKRTSDSCYYNVTYSDYSTSGSWGSSGTTTYTVSTANASGVTLNCSVTEAWNTTTYYLTYSNGSFSVKSAYNNYPRIAVYEATVTFMVTFEKNDGSGTTTTQNNIPANTATALTANTFTREGYTFTSWNTAADGSGTSYNNGASVTLTASIILYAQWQQDAPPASANTLYFTNVSGWNNLKAYLYNDTTGAKNSAFPGTTMTDLQQDDGYSHGIYSIEADPSVYEYVIFSNTDTSGGNTTAHAQTVSIKIEDALANGAGIYCVPSGSGYETDSQGHLQVNCYTYGDKSSTGDPNTITYTKQIEKLNPSNADDYNYRLHLTMDGSALKDQQITPGGETVGMSGALIIDVMATMAATWEGSGSNAKKGEQAFEAVYDSNSFLGQFIAANSSNELSVIAMRGFHVGGYDDSEQTIVVNEWSDTGAKTYSTYQENGRNPNYIAALMRAKHQFNTAKSGNEQAIIFITGNAPGYGMENESTPTQNGTSVGVVATKTKDYVDTFLAETGLSIYVIGMEAFGNGTTEVAQYMGNKSLEVTGKGGYFGVSNLNELKNVLNNTILPDVVVSGDKTSNITVTDTLSKYVDFASNKNLSATLYTGENFAKTTDVSSFVTISGDTVTFSRAAEIEGPFKLEIAFNIKTADGVLRNTDTYGTGRDGYPNAGDADTDSTTATSAGKPGYYANSSATINYTLNGTAKSGTFIKPVVQAPAETPVQGKYIFQYTDRFGDTQEVTVPVTLNSREKTGYSGNGGQAGVPTFLWTDDAKTLYNNINPLVKAALALEGNAETGGDNWQKDASVYKCDLVWANLVATTKGDNVTYDATAHTVTIQATTTPYKFTLEYYTVNNGTATQRGIATNLEYGKAVTFNPIYSGSTEYAYVDYTVPSENFSYWSADPEGNIPITTNLTYGMIMRGDYMHDNDNDRTVHIYAQYNNAPDKLWNPLIEEAKLTHTIDDNHDWVYLDYMTNYLSKDGTVVQEMEVKPEYGIVVAKYSSEMTMLDQTKMESVANAMISGNKSSAYLNSEKTAIAYRFNYSDNEHISDFNRVLYTLKSDTNKAEEMQFTAIAYIIVDETTYYSLINTDITVIDLV